MTVKEGSTAGGRRSGRRVAPLTRELFLSVTVLLTFAVLIVSAFWAVAQYRDVRDHYEHRALAVAESVAAMPTVAEALTQEPDPSEVLAPLAETLRTASGTEYVVVVDAEGIRQSHPDPSAIGQRPVLDPAPVLEGETWTGVEHGPAGMTLRARVPVTDPQTEEVIGYVSVGFLASQVAGASWEAVPLIFASALCVLGVGVLGALVISRRIRRKTHGLAPEEITALLDAREAVFHAIGEGVVATDGAGRLTLANRAAQRLLDLPADHLQRTAAELDLPPSLQRVLVEGSAEHDEVVSFGSRVLICRRRPVRIDDRQSGSVVTVRDQTEVAQLSRRLDGAHTVTQGLRAQRHEFANRLHTLSGMLDLGAVDQAREYLADLATSTSRVDADVVERLEEPSVAALVLAKMAQADEAGCQVTLSALSLLRDGLAADLRDDVLLVVGNLVDNAMESVGPGGAVELLVRQHSGGAGEHGVLARAEGVSEGVSAEGTIEIRVIDDGPGVPEHLQESIFTAGVSTRSDDGRGLRGIGLALVARACERRGGAVVCESDRETVFSAFLPVTRPAGDSAQQSGELPS